MQAPLKQKNKQKPLHIYRKVTFSKSQYKFIYKNYYLNFKINVK